MREVKAAAVRQAVKEACMHMSFRLPPDVKKKLNEMRRHENDAGALQILALMEENEEVAREEGLPICQDTGMVVAFVEMGQEVVVTGELEGAIHAGVREGYQEGLLRKSVVSDPLRRTNTGDNTPAVIHWKLVPGNRLTLHLAAKGFGSENMSRLAMLKPSAGVTGVKDFVMDTIRLAGSNPCPPVVVGVGLGGTFDYAAMLAKKALLRSLDDAHPDPFYAQLENTLLKEINALGIGPQGFGGRTTALAVKIESFPTHIAGLPVAVNLNCHVARHETISL